MENIIVRSEIPKDYREVEFMTREAFWDLYKPGCDEHLILHKLRKVSVFVKELDFVACDGDKIIGNIVYSKAEVINQQNQKFTVLCMGPFAVSPSYQRKGIGSLLMKKSIDKARLLGYKAIVIFGDPEYYHRFGFKNAKEYGIQTSEGENLDAFMVLEIYANSLKGIKGKFYYDSVFQTKSNELELFEKEFPYKEKHVTDTQLKI
jgi:predicted N-acetyltransferase YhbS